MVALTKKEKIIGWCIFLPLYFIVGRYLLSYVFALMLHLAHISVPLNLVNAWYNLFYDVILLVVGSICFRHYIKESFNQVKGRWLQIIIWSLTIGFGLLYLVNILTNALVLGIDPNATSTNQNMVVMMSHLAPFPMIVSSVILAPILEELVFRVAIFQSLYEKNKYLAYLCSGLAFGFVHIMNGLLGGDLIQLLFLLPYGLLGMMFCFFYEKKKSIFVPMLVHGANNLLSMLVIFLL